jgi:hypothetical protein
MDKSQFYLPDTEFNDASARARLEAARSNPELLKAPFKFVKDLESAVFSFRETALALQQHDKKMKTPQLEKFYETLIEREAFVGGRMYYPEDAKDKDIQIRFWLGVKGASPISDQTADWYFETYPHYPQFRKLTHYQTTPQQLYKYQDDGRSYPMTIAEIEQFLKSTYHYTYEVLERLYPFDATRVELLNDIEVPDSIAALVPPKHTEGTRPDTRLAA